jgi:prepilin-type N-terminal cleavage/methylation domain-containing protein
MSTPSSSASRSGMSLIETMVAMVILSIGLTTAFTALLNARRVSQMSKDQALAYQEIQAQIETYQYLPFRSLQMTFKGGRFDVRGLLAPLNRSSVGTISNVYNPDPYSTTANINKFGNTDGMLPLRFRCEWMEGDSPMSAEVVYVFTYRGI